MQKNIRRDSLLRFALIIFVVLLVGGYLSYRHVNDHAPTAGLTHRRQYSCQPTACQPPSSPASAYVALGNVPVAGAQVGATFYGALESSENGHYIVSNYLQGGVKNGGAYDGYDDNGEGACGGKYTRLDNYATWAEDDNGTILGNLPCGTKLEITYHGHTVVAEKADVSNGGCTLPATRCSDNGHERAIDLWWQTARLLCFSEQPDVMTIHVVPTDTQTTSMPSYNQNDPQATAVCT